MKVVLASINAKYIHSNLAVYSLKAFAEQSKEHIEISEYTINQRIEYILSELYKKKPDVLAFSCYIWNMEYVRELIVEIGKILPDTDLWLGGPEVSYDADRLMEQFKGLTGIMVGEGEETFSELMDYYFGRGIECHSIKGIVHRLGGKVVENESRAPIDMDRLLFPYEQMAAFEHKIIYYETSRGCPYSCSYCLSSAEKKVRFRSFSLVKEELQFFIDHKVPQVKFVDRTFNCHHQNAMDIWKYIKEHDNGITNFHFEISADLLREEELELLSGLRPGLVQLEIGVQSTNEKVIGEIDRTMDFEQLKGIVQRINSWNNIHQHLDLIAGLPYEDYNSFRKSFNDVYALQPQQLQLGFLKLLKGSKMHRKAVDYGIVYRDRPQYEVLYTKWLSYGEILHLKNVEEMVEVYYNSGQFVHTLKLFVTIFDTPFDMFDTIQRYYEEKGYFGINHSRLSRYELLWEIISKYDDRRIQLYEDLLLYDLYLREKIKKRPSFAPAGNIYMKEIRVYLKQHKMPSAHIEVFRHNVFGDGEKGQYPVVFHYDKRDPLTYEARAASVDLGEETGER